MPSPKALFTLLQPPLHLLLRRAAPVMRLKRPSLTLHPNTWSSPQKGGHSRDLLVLFSYFLPPPPPASPALTAASWASGLGEELVIR